MFSILTEYIILHLYYWYKEYIMYFCCYPQESKLEETLLDLLIDESLRRNSNSKCSFVHVSKLLSDCTCRSGGLALIPIVVGRSSGLCDNISRNRLCCNTPHHQKSKGWKTKTGITILNIIMLTIFTVLLLWYC